MQHGDARDAPDRSQADRPARRFVDGQLQEAGVLADSHGEPPDRLVLTTLTNCHGNVAQTWRQLSSLGWRTRSLSAFRRRATRLLATHPAPLPARRDTKPPARAPRIRQAPQQPDRHGRRARRRDRRHRARRHQLLGHPQPFPTQLADPSQRPRSAIATQPPHARPGRIRRAQQERAMSKQPPRQADRPAAPALTAHPSICGSVRPTDAGEFTPPKPTRRRAHTRSANRAATPQYTLRASTSSSRAAVPGVTRPYTSPGRARPPPVSSRNPRGP